MGKKFGLDKQYANIGRGYLQHPVINSVKPKPKPSKLSAGGEMNQMNIKGYMGGGASRGYGAARTSGMGLQDESLMPGKMVKMNKGGGMDMGVAQNKADFRARVIKYAQKNKGQDRLTQSDIKMAKKTLTALDKLK